MSKACRGLSVGKFSSFQVTYNRLTDDDFAEEPADNPSALIFTNMKSFKKNIPECAYSQGSDFFWGLSPSKGDYFMVVFDEPVLLSRISIVTGLEQKDILFSAVVEVGYALQNSKTPTASSCSDFHSLGSFHAGQFEMRDIDHTVKSPVACLKIQVTQKQIDWVKISNIRVWESNVTIK